MIKIVYIITGLNTGGAEKMLFRLVKHLDNRKFKPIVVSLSFNGKIANDIMALGIPVFSLGMKSRVFDLWKFNSLVKLLQRLQPDIVHTWMYHSDLIGGLAAKFSGINNVVWCLRNSDLSLLRNKFSTILVVKLCSIFSSWLPRRIISCSRRAQIIHIKHGYCLKNMEVIPNGFDLLQFKPDKQSRILIRNELSIPINAPLVGLIARYDQQKNHLGFIEAASLILLELPTTHFLLVGAGINDFNDTLVKVLAKKNITKNFHLLDLRDDIPRLIASLDVLVSSSWGEAFPNVVGEAMASEIPCVVTDVGDSAEIVGNSGKVVEAGDMKKLAQHTVELLKSPKLRKQLGILGRERINCLYEIKNVVLRYEGLYKSFLNKPKSIFKKKKVFK